ncbi:arsenic transporter [Herbaspirillum hiltneri N3]|uniref:Arsenic transporter n=1 Tax=Herbaspirillum hiltneri N3 TaxID=1262470 RepID=A0ABM5V1N9_9BURK|nr:ACR3 family arsenite efflux transporter [Herbaspirillum hiltneri]AKZ63429.1 arsenic transporter [Herbaspirillum hiltneri N3]
MNIQPELAVSEKTIVAPLNLFERYLTIWVALCIVLGVLLGQAFPSIFRIIGGMEVARVNLPVGALIWVMIIPMLLKVDFSAWRQIAGHGRGIAVTLFVNWAVKPFSMALLGWLFIRHWFAPYLPAAQLDSYIAGLVLLAAAPCTAMVFVWSRLTGGDPYFTLSQVAMNDLIMVFAFAPLVGLLLGVSSIAVPWATLLTSVGLYIVVPVVIAQVWRRWLLHGQQGRGQGQGQTQARFDRVIARRQPWSMAALLAMLVLLFAFQGDAVMKQPLVIALLAVPILIQVLFNSFLAYWLNRAVGEKHAVACPSALIGASNFFELAVATAVSLFGFESGAALATVVGVLIEVPLMLLVVGAVNRTRGWYEAGAGTSASTSTSVEAADR